MGFDDIELNGLTVKELDDLVRENKIAERMAQLKVGKA